jgi:DNA repair protein RadA/Sms
VPGDVLVVGEVGLTGEVRAVAGLEMRLREAAALGFRRAIVPQRNVLEPARTSLDVRGVATVGDALSALLA